MKTTGVGGKERGYDGAKKVKGRKRHLLVDTQGLVLMAPPSTALTSRTLRRHQAPARTSEDRLPQVPLPPVAGRRLHRRRQGRLLWVEKVLGWSTEIVRHPPKMAPEEVMWAWVRGSTEREFPSTRRSSCRNRAPGPSCRRVDRGANIFLAFSEQEDEPMDYEGLPESAEAFIYAAMRRLIARRLARS